MEYENFEDFKKRITSKNSLEELLELKYLHISYACINNKIRRIYYDGKGLIYYLDDHHYIDKISNNDTYEVNKERYCIYPTRNEVIEHKMTEIYYIKENTCKIYDFVLSMAEDDADEQPKVLGFEEMKDKKVVISKEWNPHDGNFLIRVIYPKRYPTWEIDYFDNISLPSYSFSVGMVYHGENNDRTDIDKKIYYDSCFDDDIFHSVDFYEIVKGEPNYGIVSVKTHHVIYELQGSDYLAIDNFDKEIYVIKKSDVNSGKYMRLKELKSVIEKKKDEFINFISSLQDDIKNNECIKL